MTRGRGLAALAATLALAGCGGSEDEDTGPTLPSSTATTTTTPKPEPKPERETVEQVPKLPQGWQTYVNRRGGFALGLPRGWQVEGDGPTALVRSFDRLVAISLIAQRGEPALTTSLDEFASATAAALRGFRKDLEHGAPHPFKHRYAGALVRARGTSRQGVEQRISVIALRRGRLALLTAVVAANAKPSADRSLELALRAVETLRSRPPREPREGGDGKRRRERDGSGG